MKYTLAFCFCIAAMCGTSAIKAAETADSVKTTILEEVVVVGERAWIEGDKAVFIPTKREKNLSTDPVTMVQRMNIPTVIVNQGQIKSLSGHGVAIFINGRQAQGIDLATFWPKQTLRVEYYEDPSDPKWGGAKAVLNFVMAEYEVGGITKVNARQTFPNDGSYDLASKLEYRRMTYGLMLGGGYSRDHSSYEYGSEVYKNIFYDEDFYTELSNDYSSSSWSRSDMMKASLSALYRTEKVSITHTAALRWDRNPGSGSHSSDLWTPDIFNSSASTGSSFSRSISPQLAGDYFVGIGRKASMRASWEYAYAHNNAGSIAHILGIDPIYNSTREDVHSLGGSLFFGCQPTAILGVGASVKTMMNWYNTAYLGSANEDYSMRKGSTSITAVMQWMPLETFRMSFTPGVRVDYTSASDFETETNLSPTGELSAYWTPNRKFSLSGWLAYFNLSPKSSNLADVLVRRNELEWVKGNSGLKNNSSWNPHLHAVYMPSRAFRFSGSLGYTRELNQIITENTAAPGSMGGIIRTYTNASPMDMYTLDLFANASLLNNRLNIMLQPVFHEEKYHGAYANSLFSFRMRGTVSYTVGNCDFSVYYGGRQKYLQDGGRETVRVSDLWNFSFTYGNGNLYLNASVNDIFHTHCKYTRDNYSSVYDKHMASFTTGRNVRLSLTYTFGYGKQVNRNIDVADPDMIDSSVIR